VVEDGTLVDYPKVFIQDCADHPEDISVEAVWVVNRSEEANEEVAVRVDSVA